MAERSDKIHILFIGSSTVDQNRLDLTAELNELSTQLDRKRFIIESRWGELASSLPDILDEYQPHVLHFSGHGSAAGQLLFADENGHSFAPDQAALGKVFAQIEGRVCCVVLNACYSEAQAQRIAEHVDVVIGMSAQISDMDARMFTQGFYKALGDGRSVQWAFDRAKLKLELGADGGHEVLRLLPGRRADPDRIFLMRGLTKKAKLTRAITIAALTMLVLSVLATLAIPKSKPIEAPVDPPDRPNAVISGGTNPRTSADPIVRAESTFTPLQLRVYPELEVLHDDEWAAVDFASDSTVRNGDQVRLRIETNRPAYLFVFLYSSGDGTLTSIYPTGTAAALFAQDRLTLPAPDLFFRVFGEPGVERFIIIAVENVSGQLLALVEEYKDKTVVGEPGVDIIERGMGYGYVAPSKVDSDPVNDELVEVVAKSSPDSVWTVIDLQHASGP